MLDGGKPVWTVCLIGENTKPWGFWVDSEDGAEWVSSKDYFRVRKNP